MKTQTSQLSIENLISTYRRYILKVASTLSNDDYIKQELVAEGNIGLWKAYQRYTLGDGEMHSYLISYIKGYMLNYLTTNLRTIKVPANVVHHINRTEGLEFTSTLSLDTKIGDEDSSTLGEMVEDHIEDNSMDDIAEAKLGLLRHFIPKLKEQYQIIIKLRYYQEKNYEEIGQHLNISREAVRLQHDKAISKLQEFFKVDQTNHTKFERIKPQNRNKK